MNWTKCLLSLCTATIGAATVATAATPPQSQIKAPSSDLQGEIESLYKGTASRQAMALDKILANLGRVDAFSMLIASNAAYKLNRLEDAGFLYYAGKIRARDDLDRFPPIGRDANSPAIAFGAVISVIGETVNPALTDRPSTYIAVVNRLAAWNCETVPNYRPMWEYKPGQSSKAQTCSTVKASYLQPMQGIATLFGISEYVEAFRIVKKFNQTFFKNKQEFIGPQPTEEENRFYETAIASMRRIESEQKIKGFASVQDIQF